MFQKKSLYYALPAILLSTLLVAAVIWAWTEPGAIPPGGNVDAPINVGPLLQYRDGYLVLRRTGAVPSLETHGTTLLSTNSGNVGIGTTTPDQKLSIVSDGVAAGISLRNFPNRTGRMLLVGDNFYMGSLHAAVNLILQAGGSNRMIVRATDGNIGIGVTDPGSTLTVRRSAAGTAFAIRNIGNTANTFTIRDTGFAHMTGLRLGESATAGYVLTADVDGVGTWEPSAGGITWPLRSPIDGTAAEPAYSWSADTNTGIRRGGADNLRFVTNGADRLTINSSGDVGIGMTPSATGCDGGPCALDVSGRVRASAFYYSSDISFKENIRPIENSLDKILNLEGVSFNWKDSGSASVGLIAQDVEKIFPDIVSTDEKGIKSLEYAKLIVPLIEAIKEQQEQIEELKAEIEQLKQK